MKAESMKAESLSLSLIGKSVAVAVFAWVSLNLLLFTVLYGDTFAPLSLPYSEDFAQLTRLDYRQFGGTWRVRDSRLVQSDAQGSDLLAVLPLTLPQSQPYQFGAHLEILNGPNGAGLMFNLQHADNRQQSHLVRFGANEGRNYLVFGYFDENLKFIEQGSVAPFEIVQSIDLAVLVHKKTYDVLVNGQPVQREIPLQYNGGRVALTTWFSTIAFDDVYITPVVLQPEPAPITDAPPALTTADSPATIVGDAAPARASDPTSLSSASSLTRSTPVANNAYFFEDFSSEAHLAQWNAVIGEWRFEPGALVQLQPQGYDYSTIYTGSFSQFTLRVRFSHRQGIGGGLLFNMPDAASEKSGHMVRYFEDNVLAWGYFNAEGVFAGQGNIRVDPPSTQAHTLQISADGAVYSITLDEQLVAENVPLINKQGHIGLTASQSVVAFEEVEITALTPIQSEVQK